MWLQVQILGIGNNGHIGFNEPDRALSLPTHVVKLEESTIEAEPEPLAITSQLISSLSGTSAIL